MIQIKHIVKNPDHYDAFRHWLNAWRHGPTYIRTEEETQAYVDFLALNSAALNQWGAPCCCKAYCAGMLAQAYVGEKAPEPAYIQHWTAEYERYER